MTEGYDEHDITAKDLRRAVLRVRERIEDPGYGYTAEQAHYIFEGVHLIEHELWKIIDAPRQDPPRDPAPNDDDYVPSEDCTLGEQDL